MTGFWLGLNTAYCVCHSGLSVQFVPRTKKMFRKSNQLKIVIFVCNLVDTKERQMGHDPEKELADSGFQELARA